MKFLVKFILNILVGIPIVYVAYKIGMFRNQYDAIIGFTVAIITACIIDIIRYLKEVGYK